MSANHYTTNGLRFKVHISLYSLLTDDKIVQVII